MFSHARNIAIRGGSFVEIGANSAFKDLQKASAPSAFHNSGARFDPPKCHPNTRVAVIEYLMGWIFGHNDPEALILWLYGPAGAGKSAILQTIAERCFERNILFASFFFGRSDPTRNTFKPLVATIAYQITITIPQIKPHIEAVIERDPLIFDKSVATQLQFLIVDPLKDLAASGYFIDLNAHLVLIDGLDECDDPKMQCMILRVLAHALRDQHLPLIFLIASRPEQHLTLTFNSPSLVGIWKSLVLDRSFQTYDDIRLFLKDSFQEITSTHPHRRRLPESWPEPSDLDSLVRRSSGQFIYASVVVKYVAAPVDRPHRRLDVVLGLRPARGDIPFAELDALYMHIMESCGNLETVLLVLGIVISGITPTIHRIEVLMGLERGDAEVVLAPLTSIIHLYGSGFLGRNIKLYHASFGDFLVDISRSGRFHINMVTVRQDVTIKCLQKLIDPYSVPGDEQMTADQFFLILGHSLYDTLCNEPLTAAVLDVLKEFSLPQLWLTWSFGRGHYGIAECQRLEFITIFLYAVSAEPTPEREQIYAFHLSSFEPIFKSEIRSYYQDVGLMSLFVIALLDEHTADPSIRYDMLFQLTKELKDFDSGKYYIPFSLGRHYRYLFTSPNAPAEFHLDGGRHAQTALRILEFLCAHPPLRTSTIPYKKQQPLPTKPHSTRNAERPHTSARHFLPRALRKKWLSDVRLPRKRREEKHRRGVRLSFDFDHISTSENRALTRYACLLGLRYLPPVLIRSSKTPELVEFIRTHAKDILFIRKWTPKAIYAMHEYLNRPEEDAVMADLSARFEAMVIE